MRKGYHKPGARQGGFQPSGVVALFGFTLIELLVVIAIIAILDGLVVAGYPRLAYLPS